MRIRYFYRNIFSGLLSCIKHFWNRMASGQDPIDKNQEKTSLGQGNNRVNRTDSFIPHKSHRFSEIAPKKFRASFHKYL